VAVIDISITTFKAIIRATNFLSKETLNIKFVALYWDSDRRVVYSGRESVS